jgi:hypothetical protein
LAILAGVFFLWRRRSQRYKAVATGQAGQPTGAQTPPMENKQPPVYGGDPIYELSEAPQSELMGDSPVPKQSYPAELTEGRPQYRPYSPGLK